MHYILNIGYLSLSYIFKRAICLSAAYLIGGVLYMALVKKNSGIQMIPNLSFWSELPGNIKVSPSKAYFLIAFSLLTTFLIALIKYGFTFVIGKLKGGTGGYQNV